jgi:uncharacterized protein YdhG (YjbR/CyaY superfamily)
MTTPDDYLARLPDDKRATLEKIRNAIRAAAPHAEEGMSYGMPAFILGRPIAGYAAHARHCSYHPMSGEIVAALAKDLEGYETTKGGIRFPIGKPLPAALIRKLVKARLAEIAAAGRAKTARSARKASTAKVPGKARRTATNGRRAKGGTKMKAYATFDLYLADQLPRNQRIIRALRRFVARVAPELAESVKWGNGCWLAGKVPVSYVYSAPDHVQFGFVRGSSLADPRGLLVGQGQYVRHVKLRKLADIDEAAFAALLRQAMG